MKFVIERTNTGFSAYAKRLPVYTTGKTKSELLKNCVEALNLYFDGKRKITKHHIEFIK